ncbi:MAG: mammalian cell entry protein [Neptuniibacter caesariensis]|uniref:Mammalian cell entry protein n=1 Tax=Neptuniibacter caesariensis TaxID=207954 RepID=A0A2G6JNA4_NEPCE|nr:MAG: mammalian cell entry protein [Neptuniibacter caesariensis]
MTQTAQVKSASRISFIWLIPLLALFIGSWMAVQYQLDKGKTIYITMAQADTITAGKTQIKVRSVQVGLVDEIRLADDRKQVVVKATIEKDYADLLTEDAAVWLVKPRIGESEISGLGTLLSGVYLELDPGSSSTLSDQFVLQAEPSLISSDIKGQRFKLNSKSSEVLSVGTGVFYEGYKIGEVETSEFDWQRQSMRYGIFIYEPYSNLMTSNVVFWINSGVELDLSADGISINTGPLSKMLSGGISVGLPEHAQAGTVVQAGHEFTLSSSYKTALAQRFNDFEYYIVLFNQSLRGLKAGAPVEYRGMRIGTVVEVPAMVLIDGKPSYLKVDMGELPTLIKIEYGRIYHDIEMARNYWESNLKKLLEHGLRASLKPGNLLTGAMYVDLDMYPDAPPEQPTKLGEYNVFPSVASGISLLTNQVSSVLNKIKRLEVEKSLATLDQTLVEYRQLANDLRQFINQPATAALPENLTQDLAEITQSMQQFKHTMAGFQQGSALQQQITQTLQQMQTMLVELQTLSKGLNDQPNMLIFDKNLPKDPIPRSSK